MLSVRPRDDLINQRSPGVQSHPGFRIVVNRPVPPVDGADRLDLLPARGQAVLDQAPSEAGQERGGIRGDDDLDDVRGHRSSAASSSAICTVLSAAPLRMLSPVMKRASARGSSIARRIRPTHDGSVPTASIGIGNSPDSGSSTRITPGALRRTCRAPSASTSDPKTACTAIECPVTTGTRTQVAETLSAAMPRILRDSLRSLSSSADQPSAAMAPDQGTTLSASGTENGPRSSPIAWRTLPGREPSNR